jgi:hypothetical protein
MPPSSRERHLHRLGKSRQRLRHRLLPGDVAASKPPPMPAPPPPRKSARSSPSRSSRVRTTIWPASASGCSSSEGVSRSELGPNPTPLFPTTAIPLHREDPRRQHRQHLAQVAAVRFLEQRRAPFAQGRLRARDRLSEGDRGLPRATQGRRRTSPTKANSPRSVSRPSSPKTSPAACDSMNACSRRWRLTTASRPRTIRPTSPASACSGSACPVCRWWDCSRPRSISSRPRRWCVTPCRSVARHRHPSLGFPRREPQVHRRTQRGIARTRGCRRTRRKPLPRRRQITPSLARRLRVISCHLGGSSSITGIRNGVAIGNSLGMSPQSGLPHNNRVGDLDAEAIAVRGEDARHHHRRSPAPAHEGIRPQGLSGVSNDIRDLQAAAEQGNAKAKLAFDVRRERAVIGSAAISSNSTARTRSCSPPASARTARHPRRHLRRARPARHRARFRPQWPPAPPKPSSANRVRA